jgi:hypothetical protein
MTRATLIAAAALAVPAVAFVVDAPPRMLLDLGTDAGQFHENGMDGFRYVFGNDPQMEFDGDTLILTGESEGPFQNHGFGVGGTIATRFGRALQNADADDRLVLVAALDDLGADVFDVTVILLAAEEDGERKSAQYRFTEQKILPDTNPVEWSPDPIPTDGEPVMLTATTPLGEPIGDNDTFDFTTDAVDQVQIMFLNGNRAGEFTLVVDGIGLVEAKDEDEDEED